MKSFFHLGNFFISVRAWLGNAFHRSSRVLRCPSLTPWLPLKPFNPSKPDSFFRAKGVSSSNGYVAPHSIDHSGNDGNSTSGGHRLRKSFQTVKHSVTCFDDCFAPVGLLSRIVLIDVSVSDVAGHAKLSSDSIDPTIYTRSRI